MDKFIEKKNQYFLSLFPKMFPKERESKAVVDHLDGKKEDLGSIPSNERKEKDKMSSGHIQFKNRCRLDDKILVSAVPGWS